MIYTKELNDFEELYDFCWSGAKDRIKEIDEAGKGEEFFEYLQMMFEGQTPREVDINDFIWFECDEWIEENCKDEEEIANV